MSSSNSVLAANIAKSLGVSCIKASVQHFPNGELNVNLGAKIHKHAVIVVDTSTNVNARLMELFLLADSARRAGAGKITALVPCLGYSRQERSAYEYGPVPMAVVAKLVEAAGIDRIITIDLHSPQISEFFSIEVVNLNPIKLFADAYSIRGVNAVIVSPDAGSSSRAKSLANEINAEFLVLEKNRIGAGECNVSGSINNTVQGKHCVLIDDIIDSAATMVKAVELLASEGAASIEIYATHGIFSKDSWKVIDALPVERICISNSISHIALPAKFKILPVQDLCVSYLATLR